LFARIGPEAAGAAAFLALSRIHEDADCWDEPDPYREEYEMEPATERLNA
jgi:hypothetical protein